jgi:hypothetical protein
MVAVSAGALVIRALSVEAGLGVWQRKCLVLVGIYPIDPFPL